MNTHEHAPLVALNPQEAAATMISEGSPVADSDAFDPHTIVARFPRWQVTDQGLEATFSFPSYLAGIDFVRHVATVAEGMNHHPDIWIGWRKVRMTIMTHSEKSITTLDGSFVDKVESLLLE